MSTFLPHYRMTVYVASLDDTASTVLAPIGGSIHSDDLKVSTLQGVAGWKPYLHEVRGRQSGIDPLEKQVTTGQMTVTLLDKKVGTNLERWFTAFTGDADGVEPLLHCKAYIEESLNGGSTWNPFFVGRIQDVRQLGPVLVELVIRDFADQLDEDCFVGRVHSSISYAVEPLLLPVGLSGAYGGIKPVTAMSGTAGGGGTGSFTPFNGRRRIILSAADVSRPENILTRALLGRSPGTLIRFDLTNVGSRLGYAALSVAVRVRFSAPGLGITDKELWVNGLLPTNPSGSRFKVAELAVSPVDASDPFYTAFDTGTVPDGTALTNVTVRSVTFSRRRSGRTLGGISEFMQRRIQETEASSEEPPLYLGGVTSAQLFKDLLDGKFGTLSTSGAVTKAFAYSTASFSALTSPGSDTNALPKGNWRIASRFKMRDFVQKYLCQPDHLGYRMRPLHNGGNPVSAVELVDMRLPTSTALGAVPTVTDADLATGTQPEWAHTRGDARTAIIVRCYLEDRITTDELSNAWGVIPDVSPAGMVVYPIDVLPAEGIGRLELGTKFHEIDALGIRQVVNNIEDSIEGTPWIEMQARRVAEHYRSQFGSGPLYLTFTGRRTANTTPLWPGDWCVLDVDMLIDPATRVRGGARLVQVIDRAENGPLIEFKAIDAGPQASAGVPTVGSAPSTGTPSTNVATLSVTLNAASDPVVVEVNVTATSVGSAPANNAAGWLFAARVTSSGTVTVSNLPSGMRVWFRARSVPSEKKKTKALPSAWVLPGTTAYVDLTALAAPTGVTIAPSSTPGTTDTVSASWTNTESALPIEAILTVSGVDTIIARLVAGSTGLVLNPYLSASTTYTFSVRYVDTLGGRGAKGTSASFTTPGGFVGPTLSAPTLTLIYG